MARAGMFTEGGGGDFQRSGNGGSFANAVEWGKGGKLLE